MKEFLVLDKGIGGYYTVVFANDLIEYSTERSMSNCIQMEIISIVENDYIIKTIHKDINSKTTAYVESFEVEGERRKINKLGQVKLFNEKKVVTICGQQMNEYQLFKTEGKRLIYLLVNEKINFPNVFFYNKNGTIDTAPWQISK